MWALTKSWRAFKEGNGGLNDWLSKTKARPEDIPASCQSSPSHTIGLLRSRPPFPSPDQILSPEANKTNNIGALYIVQVGGAGMGAGPGCRIKKSPRPLL